MGWGGRGIPLTEYLLKNKINVRAIIDNDVNKQDLNREIPIVSFNEVNNDCKIFISLVDKMKARDIISRIDAANLNIMYMTYENMAISESVLDVNELYL